MHIDMQPEENIQNATYRRHAIRMLAFRIAGLIALLFFIFLRIEVTTTQGAIINYALLFYLLTAIVGLGLAYTNRVTLGVIISTVGLHLSLFVIGMLLAGFGLVILIITVTFTIFSISRTIPSNIARQALLAGVAIGLTVYLTDLFLGATSFRITTDQLPSIETFVILLTGVLLVINLPSLISQFRFLALRTKLIIALTSVTLLSLSALAILNNQRTEMALLAEANEALFAAASQTEDSIQDFINSNLSSVTVEANLPIFEQYLTLPANMRGVSESRTQLLRTMQALSAKDTTHITSYALIDFDGTVVADTDSPQEGTNRADRDYFTRTLASRDPYMSPVEISPSNGHASIYFSAPILTGYEEVLGVLRIRYKADILQTIIARSNDLVGHDSFGVLFDEYFLHLAHGIEPETQFKTVMPLDDALLNDLLFANRIPNVPVEEIFLTLPDLDFHLKLAVENGVEYFTAEDVATGDRLNQVVAIAMDDPPWVLAFFQPRDVFLQPVRQQTTTTILFTIATAGIVSGLAVGLAQLLTRPISNLTNAAKKVAEGDLDAKAEVITNDEIGLLASTFNTMTEQLGGLVTSLETQVADRTQDLKIRADKLQAAAEIARDATMETDLDELMERAVNLIYERFGFYHVGLYLIDSQKNYAVLTAGSDESGKLLLESGHRMQINTNNNVGYTCLIGEPRLAISGDPDSPEIAQHPLLPYTKSELVIPLKAGELIIGAIDLQSEVPDTFSESDITLYRTMADQLAIAIKKNEYSQEIENTLRELETAYGQFTRETWQRFSQSLGRKSGYRYRQLNVEPVDSTPQEVEQAWVEGGAIIKHREEYSALDTDPSIIAVPMKVRGEVIGVLDLQFDSARLTRETVSMVEELANRLSLIFENARLVEGAQQRVERERVTSHITNRMRETLDFETVIKTALSEISENMGLHEAEIRIGLTQPNAPTGQNGKENGKEEGEQ